MNVVGHFCSYSPLIISHNILEESEKHVYQHIVEVSLLFLWLHRLNGSLISFFFSLSPFFSLFLRLSQFVAISTITIAGYQNCVKSCWTVIIFGYRFAPFSYTYHSYSIVLRLYIIMSLWGLPSLRYSNVLCDNIIIGSYEIESTTN